MVVVVSLCLIGCDDQSSPRSAAPPPSAPPPRSTSPSPAARPAGANLLQLCDHAQDAFRSGDLDDAAQSSALSAELQGMMDVAEPDAAQVLRPLAEAAGAIAADGRVRARPSLQRAEDRAYSKLQRVCVRAGSDAWS
jgi:hypothetical protein